MASDPNTIVVPAEDRTLTVVAEDRTIEVPPENRTIVVPPEKRGATMAVLASKTHTAGDTILRTVDYSRWLPNTATITTITATSSSTTCTIGTPAPIILGQEIQFILTGGAVNESLVVSLKMVDSFGNTKNDTISFTVVAP